MNDVIFYGVRHGTTAGNEKDIYRSWSNAPLAQLNEQGKDEARLAGLWFLNNRIPIDMIISDSLDRVADTSKIIADILGIRTVHLTPKLHPLNMGDWTLKSKADHPVEPFLKNRKKVIPGGESIEEFDKRQLDFWTEMLKLIVESQKTILFAFHGSNVSFLNNSLFNRTGQEKVGYEGLVNPGGIVMATDDAIYPLTQVRGDGKQKYEDGTSLMGVVSDIENRPPRACWNCRHSVHSVAGLECAHSIVKIDPQVQDLKTNNGNIAVGDNWCCNGFQNKIGT